MDWSTAQQVLDLVTSNGGGTFLLIVIIAAGLKRMWVFGWMYEEKCKEVETWRQAALQSSQAALTGAYTAERILIRERAAPVKRRPARALPPESEKPVQA